jgi:hypothetical protein
MLEAIGLPPPPALDRGGVEPTDPDQHVDRADEVLGGKRRLGSPADTIG